jgi:hypothetical protein
MSYQASSAASSTDLLQQLVTFLVAQGWTQDMSAAEGAGWRAHLHKNAIYVHLRANENEQPWHAGNAINYGVQLYLGTAFNGANAWNNQPTGAPIASGGANPIGVGMQLSVGPFSNVYLFADSSADNIVVVVEKTPGLFVHIGWGSSLVKAGAWTGGPYFFGSSSGYWSTFAGSPANYPGYTSSSNCPGCNQDVWGGCCTFVRADVDSFTGKWICIYTGSAADQGFTGKLGDTSIKASTIGSANPNIPVYAYGDTALDFQQVQTSDQDGRANLLPVLLWALRDGTTTGFSPLGTIPNVFCTNGVGNGFSNASEYVLGAQTYKMFPHFCVVKQ